MAYSIELEERIDAAAKELNMSYAKKKMFGGLAYFAENKNMTFAIRGDELLLRVHADGADSLLRREGVHEAIMGKRVMRDWLQAGGKSIADQESLAELLAIGYEYALSLPSKL